MTSAQRIFYLPPPWPPPGGEVLLPPDESRHALRSLRLGAGDLLQLVDGCGRLGRATALGEQAAQVLTLL